MGLNRKSWPALLAAVGAATIALSTGQAEAKRFNGFNGQFNLGRSAHSGAVCKGVRDFDDPLVGEHVKAWDVTCRGWTQQLGRVYLFEGAKSEAPAAWRQAIASRATCNFTSSGASSDLAGAKVIGCKTASDQLAYVVLSSDAKHGLIVAEGMAPITDVLTTAVKFVSGSIEEPTAVAEQTANVAAVTGSGAGALSVADQSSGTSYESRREHAYRLGHDWQFNEAEAIFAELASSSNVATPEGRAEALYNFALSVSNQSRFAEADVYFAQADALSQQTGGDAALRGLGLNYRAAHARNQRQYQQAVKLADEAIAARRTDGVSTGVVRDPSGAIRILDGETGATFATTRLSQAQRSALRDAQALEIKATSLEALGDDAHARESLKSAAMILDQPVFAGAGSARPLTLGLASPWLNTRVRADLLRLDRNVGQSAASTPQLQLAVATFRHRYPDSLPLAGFLIELARAEAAAGQDDKALVDYDDAFAIFRNQRGTLGASADLIGTYFDILLRRIGDSPAQHPQEVARFFTAAQTLGEQASAEAAKRQAARVMSGNTAAAGLARALEDTTRSIQAKQEEIRDLQQRGAYQGDARARADAQLQELTSQSRSLEQQLLQADPKYASSLRNLVGLDELQKSLRPGEVYVKVFTLANRSYGLMVTPASARPYAVELSREQAQAMVDGIRKPIDQLAQKRVLARYDAALAHDAFLKLFGPVQSDILGAKLVIYEPDSTLLAAPISALVVDDPSAAMKQNSDRARSTGGPVSYAGVAWLGARVPSSIALSPSAFVDVRAAAASKAPEPFYGFGDPTISQDSRAFARVKATRWLAASSTDYCNDFRQSLYRLRPLPQTAEEVRVVAQSLGQGQDAYSLGPAFTDQAVLKLGSSSDGLARYRVLYFATHGVLPPPNGCLQPALVTSLGPDTGDGLIDVNDIPQLKLDADMVVLSACDTGRAQGGGDEAVGLVTTFVEAGARNVVVSNWPVDSTATERLMAGMFADKSSSQADALAHAEQAMMASPDQYSHPFYWAAFTVVGDGARPMPRG